MNRFARFGYCMLTRGVIHFNRFNSSLNLNRLTVSSRLSSTRTRLVVSTVPSVGSLSASFKVSAAAAASSPKKRKSEMSAAAAATTTGEKDSKSAGSVMKAVRIHAHGGPDAMKFETDKKPEITAPNHVLIRLAASGVNFIDTYQRKGMYPVKLPHTLGREASGVVEAVGSEVKEFKVGSRVVFFGEFSYAEYAVVAADKLVSVPAGLSLTDAAALFLQGLTAHAMMTSTYAVKPNDTVLIQAGAGGTGQILIQIAKIRGAKYVRLCCVVWCGWHSPRSSAWVARSCSFFCCVLYLRLNVLLFCFLCGHVLCRVITTVGSAEKAAIAKSLGADHVINYNTTPDFVTEVKTLTNGSGCQAVYDGVGASTAMKSLKCCAILGHLILFGNASGKAPPIDPLDLCQAGSITLTRPMLNHYVLTKQSLDARSQELFAWAAAGKVRPPYVIRHSCFCFCFCFCCCCCCCCCCCSVFW